MTGIDSDLIRGHIDTIILKSLHDGDKYGLEIIQEIEEKSNGSYELKQPTLYSCLKRLETQGLISSYWEDSEIGGRRHYYTLTEQGKEAYKNNQDEWMRSKEIIDNLIYNDEVDSQVQSEISTETPIIDQEDNYLVNENALLNSDEQTPLTEDFSAEDVDSEDVPDLSFFANINQAEEPNENTEAETFVAANTNELDQVDQQNENADVNFDEIVPVSEVFDIDDKTEIASIETSNDDNTELNENSTSLDEAEPELQLFEINDEQNDIETTSANDDDEADHENEDEFKNVLDSDEDNESDEAEDDDKDDDEDDNYLSDENFVNEFTSFEEIESTAYNTFFESNSEVSDISEFENDDDVIPVSEVFDVDETEQNLEKNYGNESVDLNEVDTADEIDDTPFIIEDFDAENNADKPVIVGNDIEELESATLLENEAVCEDTLLDDDQTETTSTSPSINEVDEDEQENEADEPQEAGYLSFINMLANDDEQETNEPDNSNDDEIYNPEPEIPDDEKIYEPACDEEPEELTYNPQPIQSEPQIAERVYFNSNNSDYEEVDLTNVDFTQNQDNSQEFNSPQEETEFTENYFLEIEPDDDKENHEDSALSIKETAQLINEQYNNQTIGRASQEEIESLYRTTENYENLQVGYTDETYKQMLNELESYGSTNSITATGAKHAVLSYAELETDFDNEGIIIRKYEKQVKESNDTKIYIKTNQIHLIKSWITFGITAFALLLTFLIMNSFKDGYTYNFAFWQFAVAAGVAILFPLYHTIKYAINPYKKVVAKYAPRLNILLSVLITIQLIMIIYCVNLQIGFYSFAQENYNHLLWILPLILAFIPIINALIYMPLYNSKNYHT